MARKLKSLKKRRKAAIKLYEALRAWTKEARHEARKLRTGKPRLEWLAA